MRTITSQKQFQKNPSSTPAIQADFAPVYEGLFRPARYKSYYGGRGAGKSRAIARALVVKAYSQPLRILCVRQFQNSIADSVHRLIADEIERLGLQPYFTVDKQGIYGNLTGSEFLFKGIQRSLGEIKSTEGIDICWAEEAQNFIHEAWQVLIPTIRNEGSEIWASWNPDGEDDATADLFLRKMPADAIVKKVGWQDNPWFPKVMEQERARMLATDPNAYDWIWEGNFRKISDALIFKDRVVFEDFDTPADARFYYGMDFGFANDPSAVVRCWLRQDVLYVDQEAGGVGIELDDLPKLLDSVPGSRQWPIRADNSRPETISYVKRQGFQIMPAEKWSGSVEDGVAYLKGLRRIIVHPRCKQTAQEFRLYSYKVDMKMLDANGQPAVLPIIVDKHNHYMDACIAEGELILTKRGNIPIEQVLSGDEVMTRKGWRPVRHAWKVSDSREIIEVEADGRKLLCTPDHRIYTEKNGFVRADAIKYEDKLIVVGGVRWTASTLTLANQHGGERKGLTILKEFALSAESVFQQINIQKRKLVAVPVQRVSVTGKKAAVYDLEIEGEPEFFVSGILVHNCRYACDTLIKKKPSGFFDLS